MDLTTNFFTQRCVTLLGTLSERPGYSNATKLLLEKLVCNIFMFGIGKLDQTREELLKLTELFAKVTLALQKEGKQVESLIVQSLLSPFIFGIPLLEVETYNDNDPSIMPPPSNN